MMRRPGHTMTEMMVVLTILSLFAMLVIPRFGEEMGYHRLDAGIHAVREDLAFVRNRSVATGLRHQLQFDMENGLLIAQAFHPETQADQSSRASRTQDVDVVHRSELHPDLRLVHWRVFPLGYQNATVSTEGQTDVFTAYAEGISDGAELILEDPQGRRRAIRIDGFTGQVEEVDPATIQQ